MSRQQSLGQKRASAAWDCVDNAKRKKYAAKYGQLARSAPADIQSNGLGQTLAFWNAKGKSEQHQKDLLDDVSRWVKSQMGLDGKPLLEWIIKTATTEEYRRATSEAISFLIWLKRFAEAELPKGEKDAESKV